eukprot:6483826-Amphidinium_carterae.2
MLPWGSNFLLAREDDSSYANNSAQPGIQINKNQFAAVQAVVTARSVLLCGVLVGSQFAPQVIDQAENLIYWGARLFFRSTFNFIFFKSAPALASVSQHRQQRHLPPESTKLTVTHHPSKPGARKAAFRPYAAS